MHGHAKNRLIVKKRPALGLKLTGLAIFLIGFLAVGIYHFSPSMVNEADLPIISEPYEEAYIKVRPEDSENTKIPHSDKMIYSEFEDHPKKPTVEQLLPEPEEPLQVVQTETEAPNVPDMAQLEPEMTQKTTSQVLTAQEKEQVSDGLDPSPISSASSSTQGKPRKNIYAALEETERAIYNQASSLVADNVRQGKAMPRIIDNPQAKLKIVSQKTVVPKEKAPSSQDVSPQVKNVYQVKPAVVKNTFWIQFAPHPTSKEAERTWHLLANHKTAKASLIGAKHKVQRVKATSGQTVYRLSAGPFEEGAAAACCQKLRQARFNCKVIKQ